MAFTQTRMCESVHLARFISFEHGFGKHVELGEIRVLGQNTYCKCTLSH